jgi:hypothetical protein
MEIPHQTSCFQALQAPDHGSFKSSLYSHL